MTQDRPRPVRPLGRLALPLRWLGSLARLIVATPAKALSGTARRVADPARQVAAYWVSDRRTIRQGFAAVSVSSLGSLAAGLMLAGMDHRIEEIAGLFVLIPAAIGMRGNIFGALAARFGTAIHSGLFEVSAKRDSAFVQNLYSVTILTVATSVTMGFLARAIASLLGIATMSAWDFVVVAITGGLLSSVFVLGLTLALTVLSFRRDWDLDSVGGPLITMMGDAVTLPALYVASFLVAVPLVTPLMGGVALVLAVGALVMGWRTSLPIARRIVRESFPVLCVAIVLDVLAGTVVEPRVETVFVPYPAFLIILPLFLENIGALGSIMAARLGSKLHLGVVEPTARPGPAALLDGTVVLGIGLVQYTLVAVGTFFLAELFDLAHPGAPVFLGVIMLGATMATFISSVIGYYAGTLSYRFGFDPDNHTIPIVTSGMDLLGVICLVISFAIFGIT